MRRITLEPREGWQKRLEEAGCYYHTIDDKPYWNEAAAYEFTATEVDRIEDAANELHAMCMELVNDVVQTGDYPAGYGFPDEVRQCIHDSWSRRHDAHLYGRFDLGYDGTDLKLFEYNADTPTALPEAAVWQWHALEDRGWPDQFNSIHEALVARWPQVVGTPGPQRLHFTAMRDGQHEDWGNVHYMAETAAEAGFDVSSLILEEIGWSEESQVFADAADRAIDVLFKLYPWEWMMGDEYGWKVRHTKTRFVEPAWKMLLSTKAILPLLWKRHRNHPLLLEAHFDGDAFNNSRPRNTVEEWVRKPLLGREGANITRTTDEVTGRPFVASYPATFVPQYDKHGYVMQKRMGLESLDGFFPVLGVWIVGDKACGLGIREDERWITTNASQFVPHYFKE